MTRKEIDKRTHWIKTGVKKYEAPIIKGKNKKGNPSSLYRSPTQRYSILLHQKRAKRKGTKSKSKYKNAILFAGNGT